MARCRRAAVDATAATPAYVEAFRGGLRELGWIDGQTCVIEWRFAG